MMVDRSQVTGLVLAGGRGSRMGGVDKGLQLHRGIPLALHAARRLAPQTGSVMLSANRNRTKYAEFGFEVHADTSAEEFAGPLAGFAAGLDHCRTEYLVTVPCDTPDFPVDLVARLIEAMNAAGCDSAVAALAGEPPMYEPAFCLLRRTLRPGLAAYMAQGGRKVESWLRSQHSAVAVFDDAAAFFNVNTAAELEGLQRASH